jgi:hypothetical protein
MAQEAAANAPEVPVARPAVRAGSSADSVQRGSFGPGLLIETVYPGANAAVVSDSVRAPIEQQVRGMEKLRLMRSRCTKDGKYALALSFDRGADLSLTQAPLQNRVNLAHQLLPRGVTDAGGSVKRGTDGVLLVVTLTAPENKPDGAFLSGYVDGAIKDGLARVAGVGAVTQVGDTPLRAHVWLDPDKLAAHKVNAIDMVCALAPSSVLPRPRPTLAGTGQKGFGLDAWKKIIVLASTSRLCSIRRQALP